MSLPSSLISLSPSFPCPRFFLSFLCVCFYVYGGKGRERRRREGDREVGGETSFCILFFFYKYALYLVFQGKSPSQVNYIHLQSHLLKYFFLSYRNIRSQGACSSFLVFVFNVILFMEVKQSTN